MGRVIAALMIAEVELRRQLTLLGLRRGCEANRPDDPNRLVWSVSQHSGCIPIKSERPSICHMDQSVSLKFSSAVIGRASAHSHFNQLPVELQRKIKLSKVV